jgi:hypothetical protein
LGEFSPSGFTLGIFLKIAEEVQMLCYFGFGYILGDFFPKLFAGHPVEK